MLNKADRKWIPDAARKVWLWFWGIVVVFFWIVVGVLVDRIIPSDAPQQIQGVLTATKPWWSAIIPWIAAGLSWISMFVIYRLARRDDALTLASIKRSRPYIGSYSSGPKHLNDEVPRLNIGFAIINRSFEKLVIDGRAQGHIVIDDKLAQYDVHHNSTEMPDGTIQIDVQVTLTPEGKALIDENRKRSGLIGEITLRYLDIFAAASDGSRERLPLMDCIRVFDVGWPQPVHKGQIRAVMGGASANIS